MTPPYPAKVTIVGPGKVGMSLASYLMTSGVAREIVLVGSNHAKAEGEAMDLMHAQAFLQIPVLTRAGSPSDAAGSAVVVICASAPTPAGMTDRNALAADNAALLRSILPPLAAAAPNAVFLIVSNPVDAMTWLALEITGLHHSRVIGTGTLVDSARFRKMLSDAVRIHPDDLRAYILGEHGEHQFPAMSIASAGGEPIDDSPDRRHLAELAKQSGIEIFRKKGNTCHAIALAATSIVESILLDSKRTMPLSVRIDGYLGVHNVCLSLPVVIGASGVERVLHPPLNPSESQLFISAAHAVRNVINSFSPSH